MPPDPMAQAEAALRRATFRTRRGAGLVCPSGRCPVIYVSARYVADLAALTGQAWAARLASGDCPLPGELAGL